MPVIVVNVNFAASATHNKDLRRADKVPHNWKMDMTFDFTTARVDDQPHLLLEIRLCEKSRLLGMEFRTDDRSERFILPEDIFDLFHQILLSNRPALPIRSFPSSRMSIRRRR